MHKDIIYIWSNGNRHSTLNQYANAISHFDFSNTTNMFINTCIPLQACKEKFVCSKNITIHRNCSIENDPAGFFGSVQLKQYASIIHKSYVFDYINVYATEVADCDGYDLYKTRKQEICTIDQSKYTKKYPTGFKYNETTGFLCYWFAKQLAPTANICLVNFGIKDGRFRNTAKQHGIEFEDRLFDEMKVNRLSI